MAINIKELFNADADNIRVDKINYNFDQLLANGGGPVGTKGNPGTTGNTGTKGQKGELGNKGDEGNKGEQGTSADLWDSDIIASTTGTNINILRPYNEGTSQGGGEDLRTRIILGEATSTLNNTNPTEPAGLLNLVLPPEANDDTTSQIIFINDELGNPREFKMATDYELGSGSTFTFSALAATSGEKTNLAIQMPNEINIIGNNTTVSSQGSSSTTNILSNGTIYVKNNNGGNIYIGHVSDTAEVNVKAEILIDIKSEENVQIESGDSFTLIGGSDVTVSSDDINLTSSGGTIDLTAASGTVTLDAGTIDLTASVDIDLTAASGNIDLSSQIANITGTGQSSSGGGVNINASATQGGIINLTVGGNTKLKVETNLNTSHQSIYMEPTGLTLGGTWVEVNGGELATGLVADANVSLGHGIRFPQGANSNMATGADKSANYGSVIEQRTLADYFYNPDVNLWGSSSTMKFASPLKCLNLKNVSSNPSSPFDPSTTPDGPAWYAEGAAVGGWGSLTDHQRNLHSSLISASNYGNFAYVKTGNLINAWGEIRVGSNSIAPGETPNTGNYPPDNNADYWTYYNIVDPAYANTAQYDDQRNALMLLLNLGGEFPYLNSAKTAVHVDVQVKAEGVGGFFTGKGFGTDGRGDEFPGTEPNPSTSIENGILNLIEIKGIINPGSNRIVFLYDTQNHNRVEEGSSGDGAINDLYTSGLSPSMVYHPNAAWFPGIVLRFKFTMPTHINSYNNHVPSNSSSTNQPSN